MKTTPTLRAGGEDEHPEKPADDPQIDPPREPGEPPIQKDPPPPEPPRLMLRQPESAGAHPAER
jgi:hypothetical protein